MSDNEINILDSVDERTRRAIAIDFLRGEETVGSLLKRCAGADEEKGMAACVGSCTSTALSASSSSRRRRPTSRPSFAVFASSRCGPEPWPSLRPETSTGGSRCSRSARTRVARTGGSSCRT